MIYSKKIEVVKTCIRSDNGQMWLARFAQSKQALKKDRKRRNQRSELEELADLRAALLSSRYLNLRTHVKKNRSMYEMS